MWLLTEVSVNVSVPGTKAHRTAQAMGPRKTWAGIFSTFDLTPLPDPHPATAMALCDGFRVVSSVLPWRSPDAAWDGATLAERMAETMSSLRAHVDHETVWGGDWNHALEGREYVGSTGGRKQILELVRGAQLSVPTSTLASASKGHRTIDHVAVPINWEVDGVRRLRAVVDGQRLSDHDAYVVSVDRDLV